MYCSTCGVAVAQGLSYCNHCGAKLNGEKGDRLSRHAELRAEALIMSGMVTVFVVGLLAITAFMWVMKSVLDLNVGQILALTLLSFLIMLLIEGVYIWRLMRSRRDGVEAGVAAPPKEQDTRKLDAAQARVLPEGAASVTEQTTRTLEPSYVERRPK